MVYLKFYQEYMDYCVVQKSQYSEKQEDMTVIEMRVMWLRTDLHKQKE